MKTANWRDCARSRAGVGSLVMRSALVVPALAALAVLVGAPAASASSCVPPPCFCDSPPVQDPPPPDPGSDQPPPDPGSDQPPPDPGGGGPGGPAFSLRGLSDVGDAT